MRLVLCDDHVLFTESLASALEQAGHDVVATAATVRDGVTAVRAHAPDVCLLDVSFPGANGVDAIPDVLAACPQVKVVMLSGTDPPDVVAQAFRSGASGYVRKDQPLNVILRSLEHVRSGVVVLDPVALHQVVVGEGVPRPRDNPLRFLTERERAVLDEIVAGHDSTQIAETLHITLSTTRTHVQNILTKLGVHSRLEAAALVHSLAGEHGPGRLAQTS
jgi:two-component system nitrate/nitrite response regulator NarL